MVLVAQLIPKIIQKRFYLIDIWVAYVPLCFIVVVIITIIIKFAENIALINNYLRIFKTA